MQQSCGVHPTVLLSFALPCPTAQQILHVENGPLPELEWFYRQHFDLDVLPAGDAPALRSASASARRPRKCWVRCWFVSLCLTVGQAAHEISSEIEPMLLVRVALNGAALGDVLR